MHFVLAAIQLPQWAVGTSIAVFVMISLLLIGVILLQRPQGGGLTAAFGGSQGAGQTAFGTKTGDALTIFTCLVFAVYVAAAVFLNHGLNPKAAAAAAAAAAAESAATAPATVPAPAPTTLPAPATDKPQLPGANPVTPATNPAATPPATAPALPPVDPASTPKTPAPAAPK